MISIIDFEDKYAAEFKRLNLEWLDKYLLTEEADLLMLNEPNKEIIDGGGCIYLAKNEEEIVGSAALIRSGVNEYELAKMAVTQSFRGKGISKLLLKRCLNKAVESGAGKVWLVSNSKLSSAISLYEKFGFRYVPVGDTHYSNADIRMELYLDKNDTNKFI